VLYRDVPVVPLLPVVRRGNGTETHNMGTEPAIRVLIVAIRVLKPSLRVLKPVIRVLIVSCKQQDCWSQYPEITIYSVACAATQGKARGLRGPSIMAGVLAAIGRDTFA
jgi:hypothetical protein